MSAREFLLEYAFEGVPGPSINADLYHKINRANIGGDLPNDVKAAILSATVAYKQFHSLRPLAYYESRDLDTGWWTVKSVVRGTEQWADARFKEEWRWDLIDKDGQTFEDAIRATARRIIYASMTKRLREDCDNDKNGVGEWIDERVADYSEPTEHDTFARDRRVAEYLEAKTGIEGWNFAEYSLPETLPESV